MKHYNGLRGNVCLFLIDNHQFRDAEALQAFDLAHLAIKAEGPEGENFEVRYARRGPDEMLVCGRRHLLRTMYHYLDQIDVVEWTEGSPPLDWFVED